MQKIYTKKYLLLIAILIFIFLFSIAIRYYPVFHKGFSHDINVTDLILARNLNLSGEYKIVDEKNVVLSSFLVKERGVLSNAGNKLTSILYSKVFNLFGFKPNLPLYISLLLYALTTILSFLLVLKLFNLKVALIFAGIDIFMPFILAGAICPGFYEWAILFFITAVVIYLWKKNPGGWRLLLSGIFFGLAALARNAFLISFIPFVIYDIYFNIFSKYNWKQIKLWIIPGVKRGLIFALPVILLCAGFIIHQGDSSRQVNEYLAQGDIGYDGHLFRDPYTYYFNKDNYIKEIQSTANGETISYLKKYNYDIGWKQYLTTYFYSIKYYLNTFFRQPTLGGPLIIFFLILGFIYLFKARRHLLNLIIFWIVILFFMLIFVFRTSNWDHFLEIGFPLILLISLGIYWTLDWLKQIIKNKKTYYWLTLGVFLVLFLHLIQADKWLFHESYLYSDIEKKLSLVEAINKSDLEIGLNDVIAVPDYSLFLNYYTDYNYIYFNPETIKELLAKGKLGWAFEQFKVTKIAGYNSDLTPRIIQSTGVGKIN